MGIRLDKYLAQSGERTRAQATRLLRDGSVRLNGAVVRDGGAHVQPGDDVTLNGQRIQDDGLQYYMLHKPPGLLTAARDAKARTVMELMPQSAARRKVLPVGRLDKDTTGLLLLTNDGELAHNLLSPKRHVWKRYLATVTGRLDETDITAFALGLRLSDFATKPARLQILSAGENESRALVCIREGKFHQVKRMFQSRGHEVAALHRVGFGSLELPSDLPQGAYRPLTTEEIETLRQCVTQARPAGDEQSDG